MVRSAVQQQVRLSRWFDSFLRPEYRHDGNADFDTDFAWRYISQDLVIYDVGSGKHPFIDLPTKTALRLTVVGLDIDQTELDRAPANVYDRTICTDITTYAGDADADVIVCRAVLEHVRNVDLALQAFGRILKPGGIALIFVPSRNAAYARLNLLLPNGLKNWLMFAIYPQTREAQGFRSYYNRCTPREFSHMARRTSFELVEQRVFFSSEYFSFCAPLHILWRLWLLAFRQMARDQAAETFSMCFRKLTA